MARISSYGVDSTPLNSDKMLGTNPDGTVKNFTIGDIAKHYSYTNAIGITGQITYVFQNTADWNPVTAGSMHIALSGTTKAFSTVTTIKLSKFQYSGSNSLANFYSEFANKDILIADIENQNNYGSRFSEIFQEMNIFPNEDNEENQEQNKDEKGNSSRRRWSSDDSSSTESSDYGFDKYKQKSDCLCC